MILSTHVKVNACCIPLVRRKFYRGLGYVIPEVKCSTRMHTPKGTLVDIRLEHLPPYNRGLVLYRCDYCGEVKETLFLNLYRKDPSLQRATYCGTCSMTALRCAPFGRNAYRMYKACAKERSLDFELSFSEFLPLITKPCHYCGGASEYLAPQRQEPNGIDRVDNSIGYKLENCVSCCKICNRMKLKEGLQEFLTLVGLIRNLKGRASFSSIGATQLDPAVVWPIFIEELVEVSPAGAHSKRYKALGYKIPTKIGASGKPVMDKKGRFKVRPEHISAGSAAKVYTACIRCGGLKYSTVSGAYKYPHCPACKGQHKRYKKSKFIRARGHAKYKGIPFKLNKHQWLWLVEQDCYYCGRSYKDIHIGVDRVDSSQGYAEGNVVPCCTFCNLAKNTLPLEEFLLHIDRIYTNQKRKRKYG